MAYGIIGFSQQNALNQPSASIFGDCSSQELLDEGSGYFDFKDFKAALPLATAPNWNIDSGTFTYNSHYDSVISVTTGATTLDDAAIATRPLGPVTPGGGQKIWFEALVSVGSISAVNGVFVGIANAAALSSKHLISVTSATKNSNLIGTTSGGQSLYGFWLHADAPTNFDAVWANNIQTALTPSTINLVLASVLTPTITQYPNSANPLGYTATSTVPAGALIATATANATPTGYATAQTPQQLLAIGLPPSVGTSGGATGFVKLGVRYDGQQYLYYYVNGVQVAKIVITSAMDTTSDFAGVVQLQALGTGQPVLNVGFERTAALLVP
jgi:hypothetical protein